MSLTVDAVFDLLNRALLNAVEKNGNKAKSVAWDVSGFFLNEIGHLRSGIAQPQSEGSSHDQ